MTSCVIDNYEIVQLSLRLSQPQKCVPVYRKYPPFGTPDNPGIYLDNNNKLTSTTITSTTTTTTTTTTSTSSYLLYA